MPGIYLMRQVAFWVLLMHAFSVHADEASCLALSGFSLSPFTTTLASVQPALSPVPGAYAIRADGDPTTQQQVAGLPAFCRVIGSIQPEISSNIGFEVWLPLAGWDGRLSGSANGGFGG